jgi:rod shape-determining protein MreD
VRVGFWYRFEMAARGLTPLILTLMLALLMVVPLRIPDFAPVTPALTVIAIYYWGIYRPDLAPMVAVFAIGMFQDMVAGTPLGLTSLVLITVYAVAASQRRFVHGKTFLVEWWGFMLVAPVAALVSWILASLYFATLVAPRPLGFQLLLTITLYPALAWLFARAQQHLLRPA